jgi:hypothetical protein
MSLKLFPNHLLFLTIDIEKHIIEIESLTIGMERKAVLLLLAREE